MGVLTKPVASATEQLEADASRAISSTVLSRIAHCVRAAAPSDGYDVLRWAELNKACFTRPSRGRLLCTCFVVARRVPNNSEACIHQIVSSSAAICNVLSTIWSLGLYERYAAFAALSLGGSFGPSCVRLYAASL